MKNSFFIPCRGFIGVQKTNLGENAISLMCVCVFTYVCRSYEVVSELFQLFDDFDELVAESDGVALRDIDDDVISALFG